MTGENNLVEGVGPETFRRVRKAVWLTGALASLVFVIAVFAFSRFGGNYVNGLTDQLGDVLAVRGHALYDSGQMEAAAETYAKALRARVFHSSWHQHLCSRRYGEMMVSALKWQEAAKALQKAVELKSRDWRAYKLLCLALVAQGRQDGVRETAERWRNEADGISQGQVKLAEEFLR